MRRSTTRTGCRAPGSPSTTPTPPAPVGAARRSAEQPPLLSKPVGPYTPVVRAGDWLVVSGQVGLVDGSLIDGGVVAETRQALANMRSLLEAEGASLHDVVKTTVFMRHISDYPIVNDAYGEIFGEHRPARATVAVAGLPLGALVEIEGWAWVGGR
ncbi:MAG: RidA family protein [Acidimicrobiales bacterium]